MISGDRMRRPNVSAPPESVFFETQKCGESKYKMASGNEIGMTITSLQRIFNANYLPASGFHRKRTHFEYTYMQMGLPVVIAGGTVGCIGNVCRTLPSNMMGQGYRYQKTRRTGMLNHIVRRGMSTANTLGSLAFLYSVCNMLITHARDKDDEINKLSAGALTGMLFKSTAGLRNCAVGGGIGLGLAASYHLLCINTIKEFISDKF